jgi:hypothetical protein
MNFALVGDHPDGLDLARAVAESGRHRLLLYAGPAAGAEHLRRWEVPFRPVGDLEDILAEPVVDAVIVAGRPGECPLQLRRALQSDKHVLSVHPLDPTPDAAYEAAVLQRETGRVLLPLLPEAVHPAFEMLAELIAQDRARMPPGPGPAASPRLVLLERWSTDAVLLQGDEPERRPGFPGWDVLRRLAGEIIEISAFAQGEEAEVDVPVLAAGCFERGGLFQMVLVPNQQEPRWRLTVLLSLDQAELTFPEGWPGPATLRWRDDSGELREQTWETWNPWPRLLEVFEAAAGLPDEAPAVPTTAIVDETHQRAAPHTSISDRTSPQRPAVRGDTLSWLDEIRCLELDDAARRSLERRRSSTLEYQEAVEEASFKGTMTLMGCGLLWGSLLLLILSVWVPYLGWLILPLCGVFLILQLLRWLVPVGPRQLPPGSLEREEETTREGREKREKSEKD